MGNTCCPGRSASHDLAHLPTAAQQNSREAAKSEPGEVYTALYPYNSASADALHFAAGDTVLVTGKADIFSLTGYISGHPEKTGTFPSTYVQKVKEEEEEDLSGAIEYPFCSWNPDATAPPIIGRKDKTKNPNRVRWKHAPGDHDVVYTYARGEFDRCGDFDPEKSQAQWEKEEMEEMRRQLIVRWEYFETKLPPGQKCQERLETETAVRAQQNMEREKKRRDDAEKEERRKMFYEKRAQRRRQKELDESGISSSGMPSLNESSVDDGSYLSVGGADDLLSNASKQTSFNKGLANVSLDDFESSASSGDLDSHYSPGTSLVFSPGKTTRASDPDIQAHINPHLLSTSTPLRDGGSFIISPGKSQPVPFDHSLANTSQGLDETTLELEV